MNSRREFLGTLAMGVASTALYSSRAEAAVASNFIDAHVHVWTKDTTAYPIDSKHYTKADMQPEDFTAETLLELSKPHGVNRIVLIQMSFYGFDNRYMLDSIAKYPENFAGVAIVDHDDANLRLEMNRVIAGGVRGFRLYADKAKAEAWQKSDGMKAMWKHAAERGVAICLLADPDALPAIRLMREQYPKTRVVIDHFARIGLKNGVDAKALEQLCELASFDETYVKTSAFYALGQKKSPYTDLEPMIEQLRDAYTAERLMWATDCPYQVQGEHNYGDSVALIRDHCKFLSAAEKDSILRGTAEKVFFA